MNRKDYLGVCLVASLCTAALGCGDDGGSPQGDGSSGEETNGSTGSDDNGTTSGNDTTQGTTAGDTADGSSGDAGSSTTDAESSSSGTGEAEGLPMEELIPAAAQATCDALLRCCDTEDQGAYFGVLNENFLPELIEQTPPNAELTEENCTDLVTQILTRRPFGDWTQAVDDGLAQYDGVAAQTCVDAMNDATCTTGEGSVTEALFDTSCLSPSLPSGDGHRREMFSRTGGEGDECRRLNDGFNAIYYGTCDPTTSFCCVPSESDPEACGGLGAGTEGSCKAVSALGEACTDFPSLQLCATGQDCGIESGECEEPPELTPVDVGENCYDSANFNIVGECPETAYCDVLGTNNCEARVELGEACTPGGCVVGAVCVEEICVEPDPFCEAR